MSISLSVVVIGKDSANTLGRCLEAVTSELRRLRESGVVADSELIYVDSGSSDRSIDVSRAYTSAIAVHESGDATAAAGRTIGLEIARFENVLFLDSDMELFAGWLGPALRRLDQVEAVVGEREEWKWTSSGTGTLVKSRYYGYREGQRAYRTGGFLLARRASLGSERFNPFFRVEEESNLLLRTRLSGRCIATADVAYRHLNVRSRASSYSRFALCGHGLEMWLNLLLALRTKDIRVVWGATGDVAYGTIAILSVLIAFKMPALLLAHLVMAHNVKRVFKGIVFALKLPFDVVCRRRDLCTEREIRFRFNNMGIALTGNLLSFCIKTV